MWTRKHEVHNAAGGWGLFSAILPRWPINGIAFGQLARCSLEKCDKIFGPDNESEMHEGSDGEDIPMMADELGLGADEVVPFPDELHNVFGHQMMDTFNGEVMIAINPGSGHILKGPMVMNRWAVPVCKSITQKNLIMAELQKWVKTMNLTSFFDKPKKPDDVIAQLGFVLLPVMNDNLWDRGCVAEWLCWRPQRSVIATSWFEPPWAMYTFY